MNANRLGMLPAAALAALLATACTPQTRTSPTPIVETAPDQGRLEALVERALPPVIGDDNGALVEAMLKARMGEPLSRRFRLENATGKTLTVGDVRHSSECGAYRDTGRGEAVGNCVVESGKAEGNDAYARFEIERNLASGNIEYVARTALRDLQPQDLKAVGMSDGDVLEHARAFLDGAFGVDLAEIPSPPPNVRQLPVSHLNIALGTEGRSEAFPPVTVQKVVHLRRAFAVEGITDRASGRSLPYLPAPGRAVVAMDAEGIVHASLEDWQELQVDPRMSARDAKSRKELMAEIIEDLSSERWVDLHSISATLVIASDWRDTHGYLLPSIEVHVLPVPRDLTQAQQRELEGKGTAGLVREYALVHRRQEHMDKR